jgi:hypothetical protein
MAGINIPTIQLPKAVMPLYQDVGPWKDDHYATYKNRHLIKDVGCALTDLSMALNYAGIDHVPVQGPNGTQWLPNDPGSLNSFMVQNHGDYTDDDDVSWAQTVPDAAWRFLGGPITIHWDSSKAGLTDVGGALKELDKILCEEHAPVVVGVDIGFSVTKNTFGPQHFVLVTGKDKGKYTIVDPSQDRRRHAKQFLEDYKNGQATWFQLVGFIKDPPDLSQITAWVAAPGQGVSLRLIDSQGRVTGFDPVNDRSSAEIPMSSQYFEALEDDVTGAPPEGVSHFVDVFQPTVGLYTLQVSSNSAGEVPYTVSFGGYTVEGSKQLPLMVKGVARGAEPASFKLEIDPTSAGQPKLMGPVLDPIPDVTVKEGSRIRLPVTAHNVVPTSDPRFSLDPDAPSGASIDARSGVFTWVPPDGPSLNFHGTEFTQHFPREVS